MRLGRLICFGSVVVAALWTCGAIAQQPDSEPSAQPVGAAASAAAPVVYNGVTADEIAEVMRDFGYRAQIEAADENHPEITSKTAGVTFWVWFANCNQETPKRCNDLQIYPVLTPSSPIGLDVLNAFHRDQRFLRARVADDGDIWLETDVIVQGGVTADNIKQQFWWWDEQLGKFLHHINW